MSVFVCENCALDYDEIKRKPLSLPCGHVFCEQCLRSFEKNSIYKCPLDLKEHKIDINRIPYCYQILLNLPKNKSFINCCRHPNKKIKYFCKTHSIFPCSICIIEHINDDIIGYNNDIEQFDNEYNEMINSIDIINSNYIEDKESISKKESMIIDYYKCQMKTLNTYFDNILKKLNRKRKEYEVKINTSLQESLKVINFKKNELTNNSDKLIRINNERSILDEFYKSKNYEKFFNHKNLISNIINMFETRIIFQDDKYACFIPGSDIDENSGYIQFKKFNDIKFDDLRKHKSNIFMDNLLSDDSEIFVLDEKTCEKVTPNKQESFFQRSSSTKESYKKTLSPKNDSRDKLKVSKNNTPKALALDKLNDIWNENYYVDKNVAKIIQKKSEIKETKSNKNISKTNDNKVNKSKDKKLKDLYVIHIEKKNKKINKLLINSKSPQNTKNLKKRIETKILKKNDSNHISNLSF